MITDLLVVWHPVPASVAALRDAVLSGFDDAATTLPVRSLAAPDAGPDDVEAAAAIVLITTENFGMVSGLMKDFLERIYPWFEDLPNRRPGMPGTVNIAICIHCMPQSAYQSTRMRLSLDKYLLNLAVLCLDLVEHLENHPCIYCVFHIP